jgi:co-chaperonin GroES (HSP10)
MDHAGSDPKQDIFDKVGDLDEIQMMNANILVGIYIRPERTRGGIIVQTAQKEDQFQGKVGLVLAIGPLAFKDDDTNKFGGQQLQVGDWVMFRASDGDALDVNGQRCRLLQDVTVRMKIAQPDTVY